METVSKKAAEELMSVADAQIKKGGRNDAITDFDLKMRPHRLFNRDDSKEQEMNYEL